jgi:hypothetical protein
MLTLLTPRQETLIVNNVVAAVRQINKLNRTGYKFINQASGFIAHYDLYGFIDYYGSANLRADILDNWQANKWLNFRPGEENYEYMKQKARIYANIVERI